MPLRPESVDGEQEEIGRDALEMSGLRASLQRRQEGQRKTAKGKRLTETTDKWVDRSHDARPAADARPRVESSMSIGGITYTVLSEATGPYVRADGKGIIEGIRFISVVPV